MLYTLLGLVSALALGATAEKPNILFFLMDDLGFSDVSIMGGQMPTPNLDRLIEKGVRLDRHYIHLMCSPSRTQFITGRYSMYQGINKMTPWSYTQIGAVPVGQPMVSEWLTQFGDYRAYALGKWQLGYVYDQLLPNNRGFDHFYGFLQGEIKYTNKHYCDNLEGETPFYDWWIEDELDEDGIAADVNSMYQYGPQFNEWVSEHAQGGKYEGTPWYSYFAIQTMHGPLTIVDEFTPTCEEILGKDASAVRMRYCENTLVTDRLIDEVVGHLKEIGQYENTIIVLSTDNGANLDNEGCNYPLRGTKGTPFDGNQRTIALVSGGYMQQFLHDEPEKNVRKGLFSNLDWTPTILGWAGYLDDISEEDISWDGFDQRKMIEEGDDHKARDHIVLNVGDAELESASLVFEHTDKDGKTSLIKYIHASDDPIDRWAWYRDSGWCDYDESGSMVITWEESHEKEGEYTKEFLFDLTADEREKTNKYDDVKEFQPEIIDKAIEHLVKATEHPLYSVRMYCLWRRFPTGDPTLVGDGRAVRPFMSEKGYQAHVEACFDEAEEDEDPLPEGRRPMYFDAWKAPMSKSAKAAQMSLFGEIGSGHASSTTVIAAGFMAIVVLMLAIRFAFKPSNKKVVDTFSSSSPAQSTEVTPLLA